MPSLTATLISLNEESDLPRALASLSGIADEIVVVDSGSTDSTTEIARSFGACVHTRELQGLDDQKNYAATLSSNEWVLSIDCDEVLSFELRASLLAWKQRLPEKNGYEFSRLSNYLGGWIRHSGWYPDYKLRLYRRDKGAFFGTPHDRVRLEGPVGRLEGDLLHYTIRTLPEHHAKVGAFTTMAAEDLYARGRKSWRAAMIFAPAWTWVHHFVIRLGFLDGRRGWLIARMSAKYVYLKFRKLGLLLQGEKLAPRSWPSSGGA